MAGVLNALASYVTKMLADMARDEVAMMIGVTGKIDDLSVKLRDLKNLLADADRRMITDESVQGWVEELKHAMYQATDILDLCQLKAMEKGPSKDKGCLNPLLFCMRNPLHAHDIGSRIKALNEKLDNICTRGRSFNFIKLEAYQDRRTTRPPVSRKTDPLLGRSSVVGEMIEEDTRVLVEMLTREVPNESQNIMVVAIVGIGGIGKTTLSKNIFNNDAIQGKFAKKIWLSITQEFDEVGLLRTAITAADGDLPGPGGGTDKSLLVPALASVIRGKKFFLVLDDMWGFSEWNNLLKASFSHGAIGSRVLITTRDDKVARGMKAVHPYHHVEKLRIEDAWLLLKKQVLATEQDESDIDILRDIGLRIIEKCDGLPLAIKVMGGLLCQREKNRRDWKKVLNDAIWSVSQMPPELNYAIYLSYEDLPPCMKQCFLHFSLQPKRKELQDTQIVSMWIGEGFVHGNSQDLEEIGHDYYKDLILRNLIEPIDKRIGQYICDMHDVVRLFAQHVTRDEALVAQNGEIDQSKLSLHQFLRLSIETKGVESNEFGWRSLQNQKSIRSLILYGNLKIRPGDSFNTFSSLRILHVESTNVSILVEYLYQLKHLRYLGVQKCYDITSLPENIDKLKFLQVINLDGCENFVKLPNSIMKLPELRCIDLDNTSTNKMPKGFSALTNLRTLFGFRTHMDDGWCSLEELGPLCNLRNLGLVGLENVSAASFTTNARLGEKVHLTLMGLYCTSKLGSDALVKDAVSEKDQSLIEEVFDGLYPPPCIEDIRMQGYFGSKLPIWIMSAAVERIPLNCLRILTMHYLACCVQLPDGLSQLPCLGLLEVFQAPAIRRVGSEFVQAHSHRQHSSSQATAAFPRLHAMFLNVMVEWEEWEWEEELQAMPALEELEIKRCKLRCLPPGLAFHARSLKKLTIWRVDGLQSLENFASVVELSLVNIPYLTMISNFPKLQKLEIKFCPRLESLQEMNALRRLMLTVLYSEKQLPLFLQTAKPSHLLLDCGLFALSSMSWGKSGPEWEKFSHIQRVEAYSNDKGIEKTWHVFYTSDPYSMETNYSYKDWAEFHGLPPLDEGGASAKNNMDKNEEEGMKTKIEHKSTGVRRKFFRARRQQPHKINEECKGHDPSYL